MKVTMGIIDKCGVHGDATLCGVIFLEGMQIFARPGSAPCRKTTTLLMDHEYFIQDYQVYQNISSDSGEEVENVNSLTDDFGCYALKP